MDYQVPDGDLYVAIVVAMVGPGYPSGVPLVGFYRVRDRKVIRHVFRDAEHYHGHRATARRRAATNTLRMGLINVVTVALLAGSAIGVLGQSEDEPSAIGTGEALCPWGDELPAGSDAITGGDNTSNARSFVFGEAPASLDAADRLQASWSAYSSGAMGAISPGCSVYLFDETPIDDIWEWYAGTYAERAAPSPTEEPRPPGAPGEDGRLFHFPPSFDRESWTYTFRSRNVIAAVSLDREVTAGVTVDDVLVLAGAVVARIEAAAAGEPLPVAPSPTPEAPFPTAAEADLLGHVPESFLASCGRTDFAVSEQALAAVVCNVPVGDGSVTVTYQQFGDDASLAGAYDNARSFLGVEPDVGQCSGEWPAEGTYSISGEEAGRVACSEFAGVAAIMSWTDERLHIHGYAEGFEIDHEALYDWWLRDSGPVG